MEKTTLTDKVIQIVDGQDGNRLFVNHSGLAWKGEYFSDYKTSTRSGTARITELVNASTFSYGLGKGTPKLVGWKETYITHEMVGRRFAQFSIIETAAPEYDRLPPDSKAFIDDLIRAGGLALIARKNGLEIQFDEIIFEEQKR